MFGNYWRTLMYFHYYLFLSGIAVCKNYDSCVGFMRFLLLAECILILNAQDINKDPSTFSRGSETILGSDTRGRIETLITPPKSNEPKPEFAKAEVRILVPSAPVATNFQPEWVIRASSILMDYDEDFRDVVSRRETTTTSRPHHIRHHHRELSQERLTHTGSPIREAQLDEPFPSEPYAPRESEEPRPVDRVPVRALYYKENELPSFKKVPPSGKIRKNKLKSIGNDTWIALHSPVRIFIPVRYNDRGLMQSEANCVHCSSNITITIPRGETQVAVPAPAITICSRLAHARGRLNIAVVNGPRPGDQVSEGDYQTRLLLWKNGGNIYSCTYKLTVAVKKCEQIFPPSGGSIDCSNENFWGSKCKFSCSPGFILQGNPIVICGDNSAEVLWSSPFPTCKSVNSESIPPLKRLPCLKPSQPQDGTVICNSNHKGNYPDGSVCQFFCFPGFLIENFLTSSSLVVCQNGQWSPHANVSCLATYCSEPHSPMHGSVSCNHQKIKDAGVKSKYENGTICSLQCDSGYTIPKSLSSLNKVVCNAPFWNDSSIPECKQKVEPYPYHKDCRNQTVMANRRGFIKLKPARFYLRKDAFSSKTVYGNCTLPSKVSVGSYINYCTAHDVELNTTGHCTFSVTVKENGCSPPPKVSHASVKCDSGIKESYPRSTICKYVCDVGYIIPLKERKFQNKVCRPRLKWRPSGQLTCRKAIPPRPKKKSCIPETVFLEGTNSTTVISPPRFRPSVKGSKVKVECSLKEPLSVGNYTNVCEAFDTFLGLNTSCEYSVTVLERGCPVLPELPNGFINCSASAINGYYPVDTMCSYSCTDGNVIPTSLLLYSHKTCVDASWNLTLSPVCVSEILPNPDSDSCLNRSVSTENIADVQIGVPKFTSSSGAKLAANCEPGIINTFGQHTINCSAYDPQLRVTGSCTFYLDVQNSNNIAEQTRKETNCAHIEDTQNGYILCTSSDSENLPVGTVCEVACKEDFTIPNSLISQSVILCLPNGNWNTSNVPECVKAEEPNLISGCENYSTIATEVHSISIPYPTFHTSQNKPAPVICLPETIEEYGSHEITCTAADDELNTRSTCSFTFNIIPMESTTASTSEDLITTTHNVLALGTSKTPQTATVEEENPSTENQSTEISTTHISVTQVTLDILTESTTTSPATSQSTTESTLPDGTTTEIYDSTIVPIKACEVLIPPHKGFINCSTKETCTVTCHQGYSFPSDFKILDKGWIECNTTDGLWDFQKSSGSLHLPGCLGVLPNTYVQVWMGFSLFIENCTKEKESELERFLEPLVKRENEELCKKIDCKTLKVHCSDISEDVMHVNWTLKALFDTVEYTNTEAVISVEYEMEEILDSIKMILQEDTTFEKDLEDRDFKLNKTYSRGHFVLNCGGKAGYSANENTYKCVECPPGTKEKDGLCIECLRGTYQLESGQTVCKSCPLVWDVSNPTMPSTCSGGDPSVPSFLSILTPS